MQVILPDFLRVLFSFHVYEIYPRLTSFFYVVDKFRSYSTAFFTISHIVQIFFPFKVIIYLKKNINNMSLSIYDFLHSVKSKTLFNLL